MTKMNGERKLVQMHSLTHTVVREMPGQDIVNVDKRLVQHQAEVLSLCQPVAYVVFQIFPHVVGCKRCSVPVKDTEVQQVPFQRFHNQAVFINLDKNEAKIFYYDFLTKYSQL
jgi:hypothetical protein